MTEPTLDLPIDDDHAPDEWAPVDDVGEDDVPAPLGVESVPLSEPFAPVLDEGDSDVPLTEIVGDVVLDPWSEGEEEPPRLGVSPRLAGRLLPSPPVARLLGAPPGHPAPSGVTLQTLPWRTSAELRAPTSARLLCEADPRLAVSRLLVAAWEWVPDGHDHVRFRLADDGADLVARVRDAGAPVLLTTLWVAGQELEAPLTLVTDREERGVVLGRDLLAGRFVVDPAREEWP